MKKLFALLVTMLILLMNTACDPSHIRFTAEELQDIVEIQLIYYNNFDIQKVERSAKRTKPFDFSKMTVIETMSEENLKTFQNHEVLYMGFRIHSEIDSPCGYNLKINFSNGDFATFTITNQYKYSYSARFNSSGELIQYYGDSVITDDTSNEMFKTQLPPWI